MVHAVHSKTKLGRQLNQFRRRNNSIRYPFSSEKQDSKKYAEFNSCGRMTIGRVAK